MIEPRFMLDSNICIYMLQGGADETRARLEAHEPGLLVTSVIAYAEVMRGVRAEDTSLANALFDWIKVLAFERRAAEFYRRMPFRRGTFDRLIAAHALSLDLTLVTNNAADFRDVPGLRVENWVGR